MLKYLKANIVSKMSQEVKVYKLSCPNFSRFLEVFYDSKNINIAFFCPLIVNSDHLYIGDCFI